MRTLDSEIHKEALLKEKESGRLTCNQENHFQELLLKALKEERKEVQRNSRKESRVIFLLSLFVFFIALFQTFSFFILYREVKALQTIKCSSALEEEITPQNPSIPKDEIIQPLLKRLPPHA